MPLDDKRKPKPAPFGTVLGIGPGDVPVYSSDYASADRKEFPTRQAYRSYLDGVYMGHKWQCVELARRWMYLNEGFIFDDIAMAYDIFRLQSVRVVADGTLLPLHSFRNGAKRHPERGCLLIWNEGGEFDVTGHVAVVTEVFPDRLRIIEQNVDHRVWPEGRTWSRELKATIAADGGYWVECTFPNTSILGWVIQTADDTYAEKIEEIDRRLFNLQIRRLDASKLNRADQVWLDQSRADEAAYIAMMGGCRLTDNDAMQDRYFCISETAFREIKRATNELHHMFMNATNYVLQDDALLRPFNIPPALWPRIRQSWNNRRNKMITGRFDFAVSERGVKVYEYNADSASCHMECGNVQGKWADHFGCDVGRHPGDRLLPELIDAWKESGVDDLLHIMQDNDAEETYHALYMKAAIEAAGIECKVIKGVSSLRWGEDGWVTDADGMPIKWVWKTWAWETALDQIRDSLAEDEENLRLHRTIDRATTPPRLVDVLLREEVLVFEPLWTLIPSNKAILPVLSMMYPHHHYLLDSQAKLTPELEKNGYVVKPIVGRCGANISIVDRGNAVVEETGGKFHERDQIYQELHALPKIDGNNVQIGTFSAAGTFAGACVRTDLSMIITTDSDLLPLRVVSDEEMRHR